MSKRIYVGLKDPRVAAEAARKTGIARDRLMQAARGDLELTREELTKVSKALNVNEA